MYSSTRPFPMWTLFPVLAMVLAVGILTRAAYAGVGPVGATLQDAGCDVPDSMPLDAPLAPVPPTAATSAAPPQDDSLQKAETAVGELRAAVRTRDLGGALLALSVLLVVSAKGLSRVGVATSERAQHVLLLCGGALAGVAYFIAADPSTVREAKATVLGCSGLIAIALPKLPGLLRKQA